METVPDTELQATLSNEMIEANEKTRNFEENLKTADVGINCSQIGPCGGTSIEGGKTMKDVKDDGCNCPVCQDTIPEQFYCRRCGYVPDWRQVEVYEEQREAA
jgi:hypothetical protein